MSVATTLSPSPSAYTTSAMSPLTGRIRLTSVIVTSAPSMSCTVTGRTGAASGARASRSLVPIVVSAPGDDDGDASAAHAPSSTTLANNHARRIMIGDPNIDHEGRSNQLSTRDRRDCVDSGAFARPGAVTSSEFVP